MKIITVKQPFATLIAEGIKKYEFRSWKTNYRGELLIHAGKGIDSKAMQKYAHLGFSYPRGCIIAKVHLAGCVLIDEVMREVLKKENGFVYANVISDASWQGYGFYLTDVQKVEPILVKGKLGLWNFNLEKK